jgi:hypothetical protein
MMTAPIPSTPSHVSINRVRIVDLPGAPVDKEVRGRTAYELVSSKALIGYAAERAAALEIPAAWLAHDRTARVEVPRYVDSCLQSPSPQAHLAASEIAVRLGRNLGHVLLALKHGDEVNRQARTDWTASDWERWAGIRKVWLGGGIVRGRLGTLLAEAARRYLIQAGARGQLTVAVDPHAALMTILGASRYLPPVDHALCFDFGQTLVKRASLHFIDGALADVRTLPSLVVDWDETGMLNAPDPTRAGPVLRFVTETIARTLEQWTCIERRPARDVMVCIAAYVEGGRLLGNGIYAQMSMLANDLRPVLAQSLAGAARHPVRVALIHDGTAAAAVHAGECDSAVIIAGTALGVGFPPTNAQGLRALRLGETTIEEMGRRGECGGLVGAWRATNPPRQNP